MTAVAANQKHPLSEAHGEQQEQSREQPQEQEQQQDPARAVSPELAGCTALGSAVRALNGLF